MLGWYDLPIYSNLYISTMWISCNVQEGRDSNFPYICESNESVSICRTNRHLKWERIQLQIQELPQMDIFQTISTNHWLVVSTHLKNISQIGSFPQVGVKITNLWNHHPDHLLYIQSCYHSRLVPPKKNTPHTKWTSDATIFATRRFYSQVAQCLNQLLICSSFTVYILEKWSSMAPLLITKHKPRLRISFKQSTCQDKVLLIKCVSPKKTNMTMEHPPFQDVFPIENGDFPMSC